MYIVFCCLSTVEILTEFSVIESEAESVGTEIGTTVRVITTPYCPRMCERQDRQCGNIEALLCNRCCSGKAISVAYSACVSVALHIQNGMRMRHIVICGLSGFTVFLHIS